MKRKIMHIGLIAVLLIALVGCGLLTAVCLCADREWEAQTSDCLIVLGAKVRPNRTLGDSLRYRCESALEAWQAGIAENIIVCGGQGPDEPMPEGEAMRLYFIDNGVPAEQIIAEIQSTDTRENLDNARAIMEENGWTTCAIVTSDYHLQRAIWLAEDTGLTACGIAAPSPQTAHVKALSRLRETASWALYGVRKALGV